MGTQLKSPKDVLEYWFENLCANYGDVSAIEAGMKRWFFGSSKEFNTIQFDNAPLIDDLAANRVDPEVWDFDRDPAALLAAVLVLDQFSRVVHRGTASAFAHDERVAQLVRHALTCGWVDQHYSPVQVFFLCVAIQHSERLDDQIAGVQMAGRIAINAEEEIRQYFANIKGFPMEHYEVIKEFGRFPHRNIVLGRETTAEERAWLESDRCPGWAKSQVPTTSKIGEDK